MRFSLYLCTTTLAPFRMKTPLNHFVYVERLYVYAPMRRRKPNRISKGSRSLVIRRRVNEITVDLLPSVEFSSLVRIFEHVAGEGPKSLNTHVSGILRTPIAVEGRCHSGKGIRLRGWVTPPLRG
jgi:hypothetical protein